MNVVFTLFEADNSGPIQRNALKQAAYLAGLDSRGTRGNAHGETLEAPRSPGAHAVDNERDRESLLICSPGQSSCEELAGSRHGCSLGGCIAAGYGGAIQADYGLSAFVDA